jgi:hypothetical protein
LIRWPACARGTAAGQKWTVKMRGYDIIYRDKLVIQELEITYQDHEEGEEDGKESALPAILNTTRKQDATTLQGAS